MSAALFRLAVIGALLAPGLVQAEPSGAQAAPSSASDPVGDALRARGEAYRRAPDAAQDPDELRLTQALNAEVAAQNDLAESQDRANQAAYAEIQSRYRQESETALAERRRHDEQVQASEDARARYERDMADWRATVAACERGDRVRCAAGAADVSASGDSAGPRGAPRR